MREATGALIGALAQERAIYSELESLARSQRAALITRDIGALERVVADQAKAVSRARRSSAQTAEALAPLAGHLGLAPSATIAQVAASLSPEDAEALLDLREEIGTTADRIALLNAVNAELFESALASIRYTIRLFAGTEGEAVYAPSETARPTRTLAIDHHA